MNSPQPPFPPELFDHIIDSLKPSISPYKAPERECVLALVACTQVCRAWLPRARVCLYASIWIEECKTMTSLIFALSIQPTLASLVKCVVTGSTEYFGGRYIPLLALLSKHPKLEELMIANTRWSEQYPLAQTARLGHRTSITHLVLHSVHFASPVDLLHLVRSFDKIDRLTLTLVELNMSREGLTMEQLQARCVCWAAPSLRVLDLIPSTPEIEPTFLPLLGHGLHKFKFSSNIPLAMEPGPHNTSRKSLFARCISLYPDLRHLNFTLGFRLFRVARTENLKPWDASELSPFVQVDRPYVADPESTYERLHGFFTDILTAVRPPGLRSLSLAFDFYVIPQTQNSVANPQYMYTRTDFLDIVFSKAICDIFREGPAFANLSALSLGINEDVPDAYGPDWWRAQVLSRLRGPRAGALEVTVRFVSHPYQRHVLCPFWEPERAVTGPGVQADVRNDAPRL